MSRTVRLLILVLAAATLAACRENTRPDPPAQVVVKPDVVTVTRRVYVPIDAALTEPEAIAEGSIAQCFDVASQRRAALERANAKLSAIAAKQGTEVKP